MSFKLLLLSSYVVMVFNQFVDTFNKTAIKCNKIQNGQLIKNKSGKLTSKFNFEPGR